MPHPAPRLVKRTNPITYVLATFLLIGFIAFFSPITDTDRPVRPSSRQHISSRDAAFNHLSPPSLPFFRPKILSDTYVAPPVVHYKINNITATSSPLARRETVLILTPLARFYPAYFENLLSLTYPHELISIGFIIPKDHNGNLATQQLQAYIKRAQALPATQRFASIVILRQDFDAPLSSQLESERHKMANQKERRAAMAKARNSLLFTTLGPTTSWVLWLDADIVETPASLIEDMAAHDKPILVANCFQRYYNPEKSAMDVRPYDYNSWIESAEAVELAKTLKPDDLLLEGYHEMATWRTLMANIVEADEKKRDTHIEAMLDGVGGAALLVKADVHRDGAMFPPFSFYHLIETEGFSKMAKRLGWQSWGLPHYFVYHYNE